jgi:hypothetical protein
MEDASSGFAPAFAGGVIRPLAAGRRNIASIVGRRAAPNGVERKSVGRSIQNLVKINLPINQHLEDLTFNERRNAPASQKADTIISK